MAGLSQHLHPPHRITIRRLAQAFCPALVDRTTPHGCSESRFAAFGRSQTAHWTSASMFGSRSASVRSLLPRSLSRSFRRYSSTRLSDPLSILFCGSDAFSIASLRALAAAKRDAPDLIQSIHVVHRPAKRTGRGLKTLTEVPIRQVAGEELRLDTHIIDTFTGWTPPVPYNLVVAVSFGLFVPPRILHRARYGGLNVHPSLLPDLRGPAPIEHAKLKSREYTGVSIQTLDPKQFDHGTILAQTPAPGIKVPGLTTEALEEHLANAGAEMLVQVLKSHKHVPPHTDVGWYARTDGPIDHAPKITKQDRFVDFHTQTLAEINTIRHTLGDPWCILPNGDRLIVHEYAEYCEVDNSVPTLGIHVKKGPSVPLFRAACGNMAIISDCTYAGAKAHSGNAKLQRWASQQLRAKEEGYENGDYCALTRLCDGSEKE